MKNTNAGERFLHKMDMLQRDIRKANERKAELEARATSTNISYNNMGGRCGGHSDKAGHGAILIVEQEEKIQKLEEEYSLMWKILYNLQKQIDRDRYSEGITILSLRYTAKRDFDYIANRLLMSKSAMWRYRRDIVSALSPLIEEAENKEIQSLISRAKHR